jgi:hypothetical protein
MSESTRSFCKSIHLYMLVDATQGSDHESAIGDSQGLGRLGMAPTKVKLIGKET